MIVFPLRSSTLLMLGLATNTCSRPSMIAMTTRMVSRPWRRRIAASISTLTQLAAVYEHNRDLDKTDRILLFDTATRLLVEEAVIIVSSSDRKDSRKYRIFGLDKFPVEVRILAWAKNAKVKIIPMPITIAALCLFELWLLMTIARQTIVDGSPPAGVSLAGVARVILWLSLRHSIVVSVGRGASLK